MQPWLHVVGIGAGGLASLSATARAIVESGEVLVGGQRHLDMVGDHPGERLRWRCPLEATIGELEALRGRRVVVLASGDPMCFGVGELLARRFDLSELRIVPAPSAFSLVCARLGWSRMQVVCLSAHSRPLANVRRHVAPGVRLIVLSRDGGTPDALARMLTEAGFGPSRLWAFEHLDGPAERRVEGTAAAGSARDCAALNTIAIECIPGPEAGICSRRLGLRTIAFESRRAAHQTGGPRRDARPASAPVGRRCGTSAPAAARSRSSGCTPPGGPARSRSSAIRAVRHRRAQCRHARHARAARSCMRGRRRPSSGCPRPTRCSSAAACGTPPCSDMWRRCAGGRWSPTSSPSRASGACSTGRRGTAASSAGSTVARLEALAVTLMAAVAFGDPARRAQAVDMGTAPRARARARRSRAGHVEGGAGSCRRAL